MIFRNQFVQCRRKQGVLTAMLTFDVGHKAITSLGGDDRILVVTCLACFVTLSVRVPSSALRLEKPSVASEFSLPIWLPASFLSSSAWTPPAPRCDERCVRGGRGCRRRWWRHRSVRASGPQEVAR